MPGETARDHDLMAKNIVVCCDGTGAEYGGSTPNTNIVRLYQLLGPDDPRQISFYDPGIGTRSSVRGFVRPWLDKQLMMASGLGIGRKVAETYEFLMDYYEPSDRIFLFGLRWNPLLGQDQG